jgi:exodeoxyribonuclease VII large subunit
LNEKKTRLALLRQKQITAIGDVIDAKNSELKIGMASLDALSPLSVLSRGFSIVQTESGEILRDANKINENENVNIRLARGKIKARVLEASNER